MNHLAGWLLVLALLCALFLAFEAAIYGRRLDITERRSRRGNLLDVLSRQRPR